MGKAKAWLKSHTVQAVVIGGSAIIFAGGMYLGYKLGFRVGLPKGMAKMCQILWEEVARLPAPSERFNILANADHSPNLTDATIEFLQSKGFDPENAKYVVMAVKPE